MTVLIIIINIGDLVGVSGLSDLDNKLRWPTYCNNCFYPINVSVIITIIIRYTTCK